MLHCGQDHHPLKNLKDRRWVELIPYLENFHIPGGVVGNLAATSFRLGLLILVGRAVAQNLGSQGIVVMGQLQNLLSLGLAIPAMALQSGIQQAIGSAQPSQIQARSSWALLSGQILAAISGLFLLWLATSGFIYLPTQVHSVAWLFLPGLLAMTLVGNLQAIAGGRGRMNRLNWFIAISGPLQALWLFGWIHLGLQGLVPGILLFGLVAAPIALGFLSPFPLSLPRLDQWKEQAQVWGPLAVMGSIAALSAPYLQITIRENVLAQGLDVAGAWQAAVRVTDLLFFTWYAAFATWALPKLSGPIAHRPGFGKLALAPLGAIGLGSALMLFGPMVLDIAYMGRFPEAISILRLQCLAEMVRAGAIPLGLILISRRAVRTYGALEIGSTLLQILLVRFLVPRLGPSGAPLSVAIESALYLVVAGAFVRRRKGLPLAL